MIQIYSPNNTNYSSNGDMALMPTSAKLTCELNGAWSLELMHPIDEEGRCKYIVPSAVIKAPSFLGKEQLFKIYSVEKTDSGISVGAEPVFMGCRDDVFLTDVRPTKKTGQQALDIILNGTKYKGESNITKVSTAYYEYMNALEAIGGDNDNSFLKRWGGEVLYDDYTVKINDRVGGDYGVELRYGKNIPANGLSENVDFSELCTRIYPKAFNGIKYDKGGKAYIDSGNISKYTNVYAKTITYEHIKLKDEASDNEDANIIVCDTLAQVMTELEKAVKAEYAKGVDLPKVTIKADMVMLKNTTLYEDYKALEDVSLGDTVHCIHNRLNIKTDARVIGLIYDCILKRAVSVTLGDYKYNYFNNISSSLSNVSNRVNGAIANDGSVIAARVKGFINGAVAGLKAQYNVAEKQDVQAILFENLDEQSPMFGALGIGTQGLQISKRRTSDGRGWDWTTAINAEGIIANTIVTGLLASKVDPAHNYWNLDTGDLSLSGTFRITGGTVQITTSDVDTNYITLTGTSNYNHTLRSTQSAGQFTVENKTLNGISTLQGHAYKIQFPNNSIYIGIDPATGEDPRIYLEEKTAGVITGIDKNGFNWSDDTTTIWIGKNGFHIGSANGSATMQPGRFVCSDRNGIIKFDSDDFVK